MTYENEEEMSKIRANVDRQQVRGITEQDYHGVDKLITELKEKGIWTDILVLHLPTFREVNLKQEEGNELITTSLL